jgi:lipopolysaccharide heptosyltransferase II
VSRLIRLIREEKYDAVLDLQGLFRSGVISYLSGARLRVGFANAREWAPLFYNRKISVPTVQMHAIDRYLLFLDQLGLSKEAFDYGLCMEEGAKVAVAKLLLQQGISGDGALIILNPNARWETKKWLPERFAALAGRLVNELDSQVVIIGTPSERKEAEGITALTGGRIINLAGATGLLELGALLERADLMITCDSGPMHLAAAVGTRVLALFGPTDPARTGPYGQGHRVITKGIDCSPCLKRTCSKERLECMEAISVGEVFEEVRRILIETDNHVTDHSI